MSFDEFLGNLGYVLRVELLCNIVFKLTKNKHIGSHDELIYSHP